MSRAWYRPRRGPGAGPWGESRSFRLKKKLVIGFRLKKKLVMRKSSLLFAGDGEDLAGAERLHLANGIVNVDGAQPAVHRVVDDEALRAGLSPARRRCLAPGGDDRLRQRF